MDPEHRESRKGGRKAIARMEEKSWVDDRNR